MNWKGCYLYCMKCDHSIGDDFYMDEDRFLRCNVCHKKLFIASEADDESELKDT